MMHVNRMDKELIYNITHTTQKWLHGVGIFSISPFLAQLAGAVEYADCLSSEG